MKTFNQDQLNKYIQIYKLRGENIIENANKFMDNIINEELIIDYTYNLLQKN